MLACRMRKARHGWQRNSTLTTTASDKERLYAIDPRPSRSSIGRNEEKEQTGTIINTRQADRRTSRDRGQQKRDRFPRFRDHEDQQRRQRAWGVQRSQKRKARTSHEVASMAKKNGDVVQHDPTRTNDQLRIEIFGRLRQQKGSFRSSSKVGISRTRMSEVEQRLSIIATGSSIPFRRCEKRVRQGGFLTNQCLMHGFASEK